VGCDEEQVKWHHISREVHYHRRLASHRLETALGDGTLPVEELDDACHELFEAVSSNKPQHEEFFRRIEKPMFRHWPDSWASLLHKGRFYIKHAWQARGSGYADTLTEEGWRLFAERFFELNPHENGWRHNLARHAYRCGQWEAFNRQVPLLGKINHRFFGGEEEFEKMVRTVRERAGKTGP
jgi:hypothetical protein